jgi:hypothetical protein
MIREVSKAERKVIQKAVEELLERYRMYKFLGNTDHKFASLTAAVDALPAIEKHLIEAKYLSDESEYLTDYQVFTFEFDPPIAHTTYTKIRDRALLKLALRLNLCPQLDLLGERANV